MYFLVADTETTGFSAAAGGRVVDIGLATVEWPAHHCEAIAAPYSYYINPGIPIPPELSAVHHITDEDVTNAPSWDSASAIVSGYARSVLGEDQFGDPLRFDYAVMHNSRFDEQWLTPAVIGGIPVIDTLRCARELWPDAPGHSNQVLRYWLESTGKMYAPYPIDKQIANMAHRAGPDAYVTAHIFRAMLQFMWSVDHGGRPYDAPASELDIVNAPHVKLLCEWSSRPTLMHKINFGTHRGKNFKDVPVSYLSWIIENIRDKPDVLFTAKHYLEKATGARR